MSTTSKRRAWQVSRSGTRTSIPFEKPSGCAALITESPANQIRSMVFGNLDRDSLVATCARVSLPIRFSNRIIGPIGSGLAKCATCVNAVDVFNSMATVVKLSADARETALSIGLYKISCFLCVASSLDRIQYRQLGPAIRGWVDGCLLWLLHSSQSNTIFGFSAGPWVGT